MDPVPGESPKLTLKPVPALKLTAKAKLVPKHGGCPCFGDWGGWKWLEMSNAGAFLPRAHDLGAGSERGLHVAWTEIGV